jgi:hypothetical protein
MKKLLIALVVLGLVSCVKLPPVPVAIRVKGEHGTYGYDTEKGVAIDLTTVSVEKGGSK